YAADLGVPRTREGQELEYARRVVVNCAAAMRLEALDVVCGEIGDAAWLEAEARYARTIGFKGKYAIHPAQIEVVNRVFSPSDDEIAVARKLVTAFDEALARGEGSVQVDGRMVDLPVAKRARDLLALAAEIEATS